MGRRSCLVRFFIRFYFKRILVPAFAIRHDRPGALWAFRKAVSLGTSDITGRAFGQEYLVATSMYAIVV
jgi:hypothetical protein